MFKNTSFWCIVLAIVVVMVIHHIMTDKPLIEGNENDKSILKDGKYHKPLDMPGTTRLSFPGADGWKQCKAECEKTEGCKYYSVWSNGGCHRSDGSGGVDTMPNNPSTVRGVVGGEYGENGEFVPFTPTLISQAAESSETTNTNTNTLSVSEDEDGDIVVNTTSGNTGKIVPSQVSISYKGQSDDVYDIIQKMMGPQATSAIKGAPSNSDLGAGSEDTSENLADQGNTPQTPDEQGNNPQTLGDQGDSPQPPSKPKIETEQRGPYTFYKGLDGFVDQGDLECQQTLNANPQEVMDWCNSDLECNGYYTYSKDGTGSKPNSKRVCFKKNIDPTKKQVMSLSARVSEYPSVGTFVLTGEKPVLKCKGDLAPQECSKLSLNLDNCGTDKAFQMNGNAYNQCYVQGEECKAATRPCNL